jgi:hypothetical protein
MTNNIDENHDTIISHTENSKQMYHVTFEPSGGVLDIKDQLLIFLESLEPVRLAVCLETSDDGTSVLQCFIDSPKRNGGRIDNLTQRVFLPELLRLGVSGKRAVVVRTINNDNFYLKVGAIHKAGHLIRPEPTFKAQTLQACRAVWKESQKKKRKRSTLRKDNFAAVLQTYKFKHISDKLHACYEDYPVLPIALKKQMEMINVASVNDGKVPLSWFQEFAAEQFGEKKDQPLAVPVVPTGPPPPIGEKKNDQQLAAPMDTGPPAMTAEAARELLGKASNGGDLDGARRAVKAGADPDEAAFKWDGSVGGTFTAAYLAANMQRVDVLRYLVGDAGADPNKGNTEDGWTPCHIAIFMGDNDGSVRVLLEAGADPARTTTDGDGYTLCMQAALNDRMACLRALREGSPGGKLASVNAVGTRGWYTGKTALDIAEEHNHVAVATCLRDELGALRSADLLEPTAPTAHTDDEPTTDKPADAVVGGAHPPPSPPSTSLMPSTIRPPTGAATTIPRTTSPTTSTSPPPQQMTYDQIMALQRTYAVDAADEANSDTDKEATAETATAKAETDKATADAATAKAAADEAERATLKDLPLDLFRR